MMSKLGQTEGFKASDFVREIGKYLGEVPFDYILVNNKAPDKKLLEWYKKTAEAGLVKDDLVQKKYPNTKMIRADMLSKAKYEQSLSDRVKRSLIRHDPEKVAKALMGIVWK